MRIGYVTPRISDHHGLAIWRGIVEMAQARGVDVFGFVGGEVQDPHEAGRRANAIYDLVDRECLDGLIVWGASLGSSAGPSATYDFCQRFQPLPMVSIGISLPGIPGVVLDSYGGTRAAMAHLIEVHGRRRLAFIRGPSAHREASERYRSYCDTLAAYGIPLDPDLVSPPYPWVQENGAEAIRVFLDERGVQLDAIVAASDTFALGALPALQARDVSVPEQVSVVGFDDRPASRALTPPLTTLKISMWERGRQALSMILARLAGEQLPDEISLPARLVIRRSCGCFDAEVVRAGGGAGGPDGEQAAPSGEAEGRRKKEDGRWRGADAAVAATGLELELEAAGRPAADRVRLLDAFETELDGAAERTPPLGRFLVTLDDLMRQAVAAGGEAWPWHGVISALREVVGGRPEGPWTGSGRKAAAEPPKQKGRRKISPVWEADGERMRRAENLLHQARVLIGEYAWRSQAEAHRRARQQSDQLHDITRSLALAGDVGELVDILARELPGLGIGSCAVALYENPTSGPEGIDAAPGPLAAVPGPLAAAPGDCRLVLAYDENGRADLPPDGEVCCAPVLASGGRKMGDVARFQRAYQGRLYDGAADRIPPMGGHIGPPVRYGSVAPRIASPGGPVHTIIVEPLFSRDEQLGFIMLDGSGRYQGSGGEGQVYRVLQEQISSALKSVLLLQENIHLYQAASLRAERSDAAQQAAQEKQRLAEEADHLKSRFLSMVSHELRTPLILLEGLSEMMLREGLGSRPPLPAPYRQDLDRIRATSQQLGGLVRDVLDLARSQVGQLRLALKPLDLAAVLQPTILVGEQMARSKGLDWQVEIDEDLPEVRGDGARLQEITLNLISNAVKFTALGEVRLRIEADAGDAAPGVTVSISDTGLGVPLEEQQAIFDEFRQSERTASRGFGGLGVGLAICREIVQLHGGEIGVRSSGRVDGGSTFYFRLPALAPAAARQAGGVPAAQAGEAAGGWATAGVAPTAASGTGRWQESRRWQDSVVLLTEQAAGGELLRSHLREQGFDVAVLPVEEQEDWLAQLLSLRPGAVVLDLQPTWEQGWQLFDVLKHSQATEDIPVLLYSLLAEQGQGSVLALDYLAKPMGPAALARALQNLGLADHDAQDQAILIADDDPDIRALHRDMVRERFPGCRILEAADGVQALELLQREEAEGRPQGAPLLFVLLDLMMPELDGIGVLEAMQRDARLRDIPVIVLTAQRLSEDDMGRLGRGVASILQKGMFTTEETLAQVQGALARNKRLGSETQRLARKVMAYIHAHYAGDISREQMASYAGISERHLTRCFVQEAGLSPIDYLNRFRVVQARRLLDEGRMNITEIMNAVGFRDSSYFSRIFRREVGMSPSAYRNQTP